MLEIFYLIFSFLFGAIPIGFLLGKLCGVDVRKSGSGNVGATNVLRLLGKKAGILTFVLDLLKGAVPVLLINALPYLVGLKPLESWFGFFTVLGHCYSPFLRFKGGKGVATGFGAFLVLEPSLSVICFSWFILVFYLTRLVSLASILAVGLFPVFLIMRFLWTDSMGSEVIFSGTFVCLLIIYHHKENIKRLRGGTELRFGNN